MRTLALAAAVLMALAVRGSAQSSDAQIATTNVLDFSGVVGSYHGIVLMGSAEDIVFGLDPRSLWRERFPDLCWAQEQTSEMKCVPMERVLTLIAAEGQ